MDDCIEMSCRHEKSDVAFMLGSMCFAVSCYSDDLCKTVPIFGSSISRLNLNPAISFLRKKAHLRTESLGEYFPASLRSYRQREVYLSLQFLVESCYLRKEQMT